MKVAVLRSRVNGLLIKDQRAFKRARFNDESWAESPPRLTQKAITLLRTINTWNQASNSICIRQNAAAADPVFAMLLYARFIVLTQFLDQRPSQTNLAIA